MVIMHKAIAISWTCLYSNKEIDLVIVHIAIAIYLMNMLIKQ